jgi:hypothetical protein
MITWTSPPRRGKDTFGRNGHVLSSRGLRRAGALSWASPCSSGRPGRVLSRLDLRIRRVGRRPGERLRLRRARAWVLAGLRQRGIPAGGAGNSRGGWPATRSGCIRPSAAIRASRSAGPASASAAARVPSAQDRRRWAPNARTSSVRSTSVLRPSAGSAEVTTQPRRRRQHQLLRPAHRPSPLSLALWGRAMKHAQAEPVRRSRPPRRHRRVLSCGICGTWSRSPTRAPSPPGMCCPGRSRGEPDAAGGGPGTPAAARSHPAPPVGGPRGHNRRRAAVGGRCGERGRGLDRSAAGRRALADQPAPGRRRPRLADGPHRCAARPAGRHDPGGLRTRPVAPCRAPGSPSRHRHHS